MSTSDPFSRIVEAIYRSALWPEGWSSVSTEIHQAFSAQHVIIDAGETFNLSGMMGVEPAAVQAVFVSAAPIVERYAREAPRTALLVPQDVFTDDRAYERSEEYQQVVRPLGGYNGLTTFGGGGLSLAVCRGRSRPFEDKHRLDVARLLPHLACVREIVSRIGLINRTSQALARLVDQAGEALILIDDQHRVVLTNASARALCKRAGMGLAAGGRLSVANAIGATALRAALARACAPDGLSSWISLECEGRSAGLVARVMPFTPDRFSFDATGSIRAAVFLKDVAAPLRLDRVALGDLFGLTGREIDVVEALVRGEAPATIASNLRVSIATVRTHLASAYEKTGTRSQAGLVAHLAHLRLQA